MEQIQEEQAQAQQAPQMQSLTDQAGQLAGTPLMDPSKNPDIIPALQEAAPALAGAVPPQ